MKGEWIATKDKLHPDKPGLYKYEQIRCLVIFRGRPRILMWNCEHLCWDDEEGDDFFCNAADVTYWHEIIGPDQHKGD